MQREIFHSIGVQGDFGLKCLAKVNQVYTDDAVFLRQFYEHVQKEEMVMDEAEMPEALFKSKYETLNRFREDMEARMSKMKDMSPEEQAAYMSQVYKEILAQSIGADECCSNPHGCSHRHHHGAAGPQPPAAQGAPSVALVPGAAGAQAAQPPVAAGPSVASAMTEAEQLDFFSSLSNTSGKP
ncbi:hypothetical protein Vretimale_10680 [Volvox reticuliferus]|nr:hypothetical protein Vretifemale_13920 [Volvox reticuliferus]GIM06349.1 hypothetical protein Vretimale_10680 [Volvox reticuliferus]